MDPNKDQTLKQLFQKTVRDYSYAIIFFVTFSFFGYFVIKPNLTTVFSLQKELEELKILKVGYDQVVGKIIDVQTLIEGTREDIPILEGALPKSPLINQLVDDIRNVASNSGIIMDKLDISRINLRDGETRANRDKIHINFETSSSFSIIKRFIDDLYDQRRLKVIDNITVSRDPKAGTSSAALKIKLEIEGYYL